MSYVSMGDLFKRWTRPPQGHGVYTRQGIQKLVRSADFPAPAITDGAGRVKLWHPADIAAFETSHPEVTDADAKWKKIRKAGRRALYARRMKGGTLPPDE
jgi:formylmethanofuran dehydrogenase subunit A